MSGCSQGAQSKMAFDADSTFDASSIVTDYMYEGMKKEGRLVGGQGITGSRSRIVERVRVGAYPVGGKIGLQPGPGLLDFLLPRILGATEDADDFDLAESLQSMSVMIDKVGSIFRYDNAYVNRAVFRATAGPGDNDPEIVELVLDLIAKTETGGLTWPGTVPALTITSNFMPYILSDAVLTIGGTPYQFKQFALVVENFLQTRWVNSLTANQICPRDRRVSLIIENPFTSTEYAAFYGSSDQSTGLAATLVFTNGTMSTTFTMPCLTWPDETPTVRGKQEIPYWIVFDALSSDADPELTVTNDSVE